jgi:hypothetical protein
MLCATGASSRRSRPRPTPLNPQRRRIRRCSSRSGAATHSQASLEALTVSADCRTPNPAASPDRRAHTRRADSTGALACARNAHRHPPLKRPSAPQSCRRRITRDAVRPNDLEGRPARLRQDDSEDAGHRRIQIQPGAPRPGKRPQIDARGPGPVSVRRIIELRPRGAFIGTRVAGGVRSEKKPGPLALEDTRASSRFAEADAHVLGAFGHHRAHRPSAQHVRRAPSKQKSGAAANDFARDHSKKRGPGGCSSMRAVLNGMAATLSPLSVPPTAPPPCAVAIVILHKADFERGRRLVVAGAKTSAQRRGRSRVPERPSAAERGPNPLWQSRV